MTVSLRDILVAAFSSSLVACSAPSSGAGSQTDDDASALVDSGAVHDAASPADASVDGSAADTSTGVHNGSCCVRSSSDDSMCASRSESPEAYTCFCPIGGDGGTIDPSCTINAGTELVCCP